MGWTGHLIDCSSVKEFCERELSFKYEPGMTLLDRSIKGREVYSLVHITKDGRNEKIIFMDLVEKKRGEREWLHKSMDENMGPAYYNCPEKILKQSTSTSEYAIEWREKCRSLRKETAEKNTLLALLKSGMKITDSFFGELEYRYMLGKSQMVCMNISKNKMYRYNLKDFELETIKSAFSNLANAS